MLWRMIKMQIKVAVNKQELWQKAGIFEKLKTSVTSKTVPGVFPYCMYFLSGMISMQGSLRGFQVPVLIFFPFRLSGNLSFLCLPGLWSVWKKVQCLDGKTDVQRLHKWVSTIFSKQTWSNYSQIDGRHTPLLFYRRYIKISLWNF